MSFRAKLSRLSSEKKTVLCIGLDPALPRQRRDAVIPQRYLDSKDENQERLRFCLDMIDLVKDYAIAIKPNQQYIFGFTKQDHKELTRYVKKNNMVSILDYKLNDISDTVASAIFHLSESGYDAITFNPLPGNLQEAVNLAHNIGAKTGGDELGVIVLTLMSNPEAVGFMKKARVGKVPLFQFIAKQVKIYDADGCVVGATGHVSEQNIRTIRRTAGFDKVLLIPGVGTQKGDIMKALKTGESNILVNVGRDIIYSDDPKRKAKEYCAMLLTR